MQGEMRNTERIMTCGDIVGESPVWSERRGQLLWVDIVGRRIHAYTPGSGDYRIWQTPDLVTSIGLRRDGGAIVGLRRHVALWDFDRRFEPLAEIEPDCPDNRLNEGRVGPDGAFWVGTMQDNIAADGQPKAMDRASGAFYRIDRDGRVDRLTPRDIGICNTMAWTAEGRFLCADTLANQLYSYRWDGGALSERRPFATHPRGLPDGSALDADGCLWNARVGGGCVVRFSPEGDALEVVDLPCSAPTSCAFGGPDLKTMFVTSARFGLPDARRDHLDEGALFAFNTNTPGLSEHLFG